MLLGLKYFKMEMSTISKVSKWFKGILLLSLLLQLTNGISSYSRKQRSHLLASIESPLTKSHVRKAFALMDSGRCKHIFLDVGANVGIQLRKLYEPKYYPKATFISLFDKTFGTNRSEVCAIGFEPNPHRTARLKSLETSYNSVGFPLIIFYETAVNTVGTNVSFYTEPYEKAENHEWGASLLQWNQNMPHVNSGSVPFANFLKTVIFSRKGKTDDSKILMKLDVEGFEYTLLPTLITSGVLCDIDFFTCEFHPSKSTDNPRKNDIFAADINYILRRSKDCKGQMMEFDDESYGQGKDLYPLPIPNNETVKYTPVFISKATSSSSSSPLNSNSSSSSSSSTISSLSEHNNIIISSEAITTSNVVQKKRKLSTHDASFTSFNSTESLDATVSTFSDFLSVMKR